MHNQVSSLTTVQYVMPSDILNLYLGYLYSLSVYIDYVGCPFVLLSSNLSLSSENWDRGRTETATLERVDGTSDHAFIPMEKADYAEHRNAYVTFKPFGIYNML